jgi:hypothetical protein
VASEHEVLYAALAAPFGLVVRGSISALREARSGLSEDPALVDLAILGPDGAGQVWLVRKDAIRRHVDVGEAGAPR